MNGRGQPAPVRRPARAAPARRGRDGTATRARIEQEALALFAQKGIDGTSVRDIALRAGLSEGALYRHFPSKEELARELFLSHYAALAGAICAIEAQAVPLDDKLRKVVALACRLFDEEPALFAYLLIHQHDHLRHVPEAPETNVVEAVALLLRGAGLPPERASLAGAMALGCVVQPAVFALYGRLNGPLSTHVDAITRAVSSIIAGARGPWE